MWSSLECQTFNCAKGKKECLVTIDWYLWHVGMQLRDFID